ncbi:uncharacterized protein LOC134818358 [Bolinopsis microptera]|uniref:uncharacterized protein LOC134818358 n=1 Tax=Bolinopsis microptera TaxID=2820187 RepID=UPI0030790472
MQSLSFLVFTAFCLVVSDAADPPINVEPDQWHDKPFLRDINIPNQADVYMKTDLAIGSGTDLRINYNENNGDFQNMGSFVLKFSDPPKYGFLLCTDFNKPSQDLPVDLPAKDDDGFRIFKVEMHGKYGLKISCNDEMLITFEPSDAVCTGWSSFWRDTWEKNKEVISFSFDKGVRKYKISSSESAVDGGYSAFGDWSKCSADCDGGTQTRTRQCNDPAPSNGGKECEGDDSETQTCNEDPCSDLYHWNDKPIRGDIELPNQADVYMKTDLAIGSGKNLIINYKNNAGEGSGGFKLLFLNPPKYGFLKCTELQDANLDLPVDLPAKDDDGIRIFKVETHGTNGLKISCNDEMLITFEPSDAVCTGWSSFWRDTWEKNKEMINFSFDEGVTKYRTSKKSEVDGGYSAFGDWSKCSADCDGGTQTRTRQCNDPAPSNGGKECEGDDSETQTCNEDPCPVDGGYSAFGDWSKCSADCDGGTQTRTRQCNDPAPSNGGKECEGDDSETQTCNEDPCPIDGGYGAFGDWSKCSSDCDGGTQTRTRQCNDPAPSNGGKECEGDDSETQTCNEDPCTVDGGWSAFGDWSKYCSADCGGGTQTRTRQCNDPAPSNGGKECEGNDFETQTCNKDPCTETVNTANLRSRSAFQYLAAVFVCYMMLF